MKLLLIALIIQSLSKYPNQENVHIILHLRNLDGNMADHVGLQYMKNSAREQTGSMLSGTKDS
jgi:hypothetical protein